MLQVLHTGSTKKVLQSTKSGRNRHINILTYQYQYVKCRGGHYRDFGVSTSSVEFLNNALSYGICQAERKDYSSLWHLGNCNRTWEIPKISTRRPQTPNKAIGTLCCKCCTQEALKKSTAKYKE